MDRENIAPIPQAGMTEENTKKKKVKEVLEYAESLTVVFAVMLLIFTFIARPATVDGESMLPTLCNGERLVISNLFGAVRRGGPRGGEKPHQAHHRGGRTDHRHRF